MSSVNIASLRDEIDALKADIVSLRKEGKTTSEIDAILEGLCCMLEFLLANSFEEDDPKDR